MNDEEQTNPPVQTVEVDGARLAYAERGNGEPLVFIHGAVSDYRSWSEQLEEFADDYRVIAYSRRAHYPNARKADSNYTRGVHVRDLIALLKTLHLGKAHLVGHSYGAAIALLAALEAPELVSSLVLGEPSPFPQILDADAQPLLDEQKRRFDKVARFARNGDETAAVREFLHVVIGIDAFCLLPAERRAVVLANAGTLLPMLRTFYDSALTGEKLKKLTAPAMLVTGEISPVLARLGCKALDRLLPNSKIAVLKCASHGLHMENPKDYNRLLADFLSVNKITARLDKDSLLYSPIFNQKLD
ncbi:MAG TPA: alpha/beta hydrolase [Pyrinomonadaceae bacterium]|jgi:pimeloyl-ACP methyl ester carboxylesterase